MVAKHTSDSSYLEAVSEGYGRRLHPEDPDIVV
jgi:hypothetical protein